MPWPDYDLSTADISSIYGFGLFGALRLLTYAISTSQNSIVIYDACNTYKLQSLPALIYINGMVNPSSIKPTSSLIISVTDSSNGQIASLLTNLGPIF